MFCAVLWIWDVYPGSEFFHPGSRVKKKENSGSRIRIVEFECLKPKKTVSKLSEKWDVHPGSRFFSTGQKTPVVTLSLLTVSHFLRLLCLVVSHCLVLHRHKPYVPPCISLPCHIGISVYHHIFLLKISLFHPRLCLSLWSHWSLSSHIYRICLYVTLVRTEN